jgi:hypothetical protein
MRNGAAEVETRLARARERFEEWRRTRRGRRIPPPLWLEAARVARTCGVQRTARELRLNPTSLRERMRGADSETSGPAAFVELAPEHLVGAGALGLVVEVERPSGARLRIELRGAQAPDVMALTRGILEGERCWR